MNTSSALAQAAVGLVVILTVVGFVAAAMKYLVPVLWPDFVPATLRVYGNTLMALLLAVAYGMGFVDFFTVAATAYVAFDTPYAVAARRRQKEQLLARRQEATTPVATE